MITTDFFTLKLLSDGNVEASLVDVRGAELIRASALTLSHHEVAKRAPHVALPGRLHEILLRGENPNDSFVTEIQSLKGVYREPAMKGLEAVANGDSIQIGDATLSLSSRRWSIQTKGGRPGHFKGSLLLFVELMATVNMDVAVDDSELSKLFRPWLALRSPSAWNGLDLKKGEPVVLPKLSDDPMLGQVLRYAQRLTEAARKVSTSAPQDLTALISAATAVAMPLISALEVKGIEPAKIEDIAGAKDIGEGIPLPEGMERSTALKLLQIRITPEELQAQVERAAQVLADAEARAAQIVATAVQEAQELNAESLVRARAAALAEQHALRR